MNVGIILSWFNQRYFRDSLSIWCEFIPQMVFLNALFGYLCILIIAKWATGSYADLYHVMIYMFLSPGNGGLECATDEETGALKTPCAAAILPGFSQGYLQVCGCECAGACLRVCVHKCRIFLGKSLCSRSVLLFVRQSFSCLMQVHAHRGRCSHCLRILIRVKIGASQCCNIPLQSPFPRI